ncbi:MAG: ATP cone domain-containing protein, partial [Cetobacterium sp.]
MNIIKKNGLIECFAEDKIINAIKKSSERIAVVLDIASINNVVDYVKKDCNGLESIKVVDLHGVVERALDSVNRDVAKSYKDYRNYKKEFGLYLMDDIEEQVKKTLHEVDRENSNSNTRYISTKRTEIAQTFSKEMYQKMYLSKSVLAAMKDG